MALSNIWKEPGREISEQAAGVFFFIFILGFDFLGGLWFQYYTGGPKEPFPIQDNGHFCPWPLGMVLVPIVLVIGGGILTFAWYGLHALGESVCARMAALGIDPRPKIRNVKWWWSVDPRIAQKAELERQLAARKASISGNEWPHDYTINSLGRQIRNLGI